ncbi:hypothetical protein LC612_30190 [Nostoc sp. CHAB 5834]|nr:hypothetical protein [Nostoc sp. CHAB 5834]
MFSLIITIISIALVAALALATLYYGGSSFNRGAAGAEAARLINEGQQINGAVALAKSDSVEVATLQDLVDDNYLSQVPASFLGTADASGTSITTNAAKPLSKDACLEVEKRAGRQAKTVELADFTASVDAAALGDVQFGCFGSGSAYTFVYKL